MDDLINRIHRTLLRFNSRPRPGYPRALLSEAAERLKTLEAEIARFQAERAASLESFRRALCVALDVDREGLQDPAELDKAWSEVLICAECYPVAMRTAASFEGCIADASAALDAAGIPHVAGVSIADRVRTLAAELEKPVARQWSDRGGGRCWTRSAFRLDGMLDVAAEVTSNGPTRGWTVVVGHRLVDVFELADPARHAADLALVAEGYRLVDGVHPLTLETKP